MSGVDIKLTQKEERSKKRKSNEDRKMHKEKERRKQTEDVVAVESNSDDNETLSENSSDDQQQLNEVSTQNQYPKKPHKAVNIITPELASALDRTKVSDRDAVFLLSATASSLGHDISRVAVNRTSIRTARLAHRKQLSSTVKLDFQNNPNLCLVVHWDGKMLPNITGKGNKVDRLPIIVTGDGKEKLLDVPKLPRGTGEEIASAVFKTVVDWNLKDNIRAMSFDTTASNTGQYNGACHYLEQKLGKDLLYLPCRHHILEISIGAVFDKCLGPSTGPNILLFKRFRDNWSNIDISQFRSGIQDKETCELLNNWNDGTQNILDFATNALTELQPRDDYKEFLELVIIFLGGTPNRGIRFIAPGAYHRARWMAKIIYSLKIWMFRCQFHLTTSETRGLRDVNIFCALLYTKAWFTSSCALSAPSNDLQLLKNLVSYSAINEEIADVATNKLLRHLWYLSEYNIALSFFDKAVEIPTKRKMVEALKKKYPGEAPKCAVLLQKDIQDRCLEDFVTEKTLNFFILLGISHDFLQSDPEEWSTNEDFTRAREIVKKLRVVNDVAERGVALIQEYNDILTKDEEQKQYLLQVVEDHRKKCPNSKKATLLEHMGQLK